MPATETADHHAEATPCLATFSWHDNAIICERTGGHTGRHRASVEGLASYEDSMLGYDVTAKTEW